MNLACQKSPTSPNGSQWTEATANAFSSGRYGLAGTVFNNQMWAMGGASGPATTYYSDVYSSGNGSSWTKVNGNAPFGCRYGSQVLSFNGQLWLIGGNNSGTLMNDVWTSTDGKAWTRVLASSKSGTASQFSPREDFGAVVFNNAMWVMGGFTGYANNDVWSSTDGVNWSEVLADNKSTANQYQPCWGFSAVVYKNLIWIFGGASGDSSGSVTAAFGDVWNSPDGTNWTRVSYITPFGPSHYQQTVVNSGGLLTVSGGFLSIGWGSQCEYDTSTDGLNWKTTSGAFPYRFGHLSLEFNNNVWIIGGCDDYCDNPNCSIIYLNDVWYTQ